MTSDQQRGQFDAAIDPHHGHVSYCPPYRPEVLKPEPNHQSSETPNRGAGFHPQLRPPQRHRVARVLNRGKRASDGTEREKAGKPVSSGWVPAVLVQQTNCLDDGSGLKDQSNRPGPVRDMAVYPEPCEGQRTADGQVGGKPSYTASEPGGDSE